MAQPTPPVHFENRLAVNTFMQQRIKAHALTSTQLARHLGLQHAGSVINLFRGRILFSRSKHFHPLCTLLEITVEEREAIRQAEQGRR